PARPARRARPRAHRARPALQGLERASGRTRKSRAEHRPRLATGAAVPTIRRTMIYCVIPRELADELYDKMVEYYKDNPNVEVIVDRREGPDRRAGKPADEFQEKRLLRDRRRRRPGTFPDTDPPEAG